MEYSLSYNVQNPWILGLDEFMKSSVPKDPKNTSSPPFFYNYEVFKNYQYYQIMTNLEDNNDPDRRKFSAPNVLEYSPCNEAGYYSVSGTYKNNPPYDWCVSTP